MYARFRSKVPKSNTVLIFCHLSTGNVFERKEFSADLTISIACDQLEPALSLFATDISKMPSGSRLPDSQLLETEEPLFAQEIDEDEDAEEEEEEEEEEEDINVGPYDDDIYGM